jgi:hypothetical protein
MWSGSNRVQRKEDFLGSVIPLASKKSTIVFSLIDHITPFNIRLIFSVACISTFLIELAMVFVVWERMEIAVRNHCISDLCQAAKQHIFQIGRFYF